MSLTACRISGAIPRLQLVRWFGAAAVLLMAACSSSGPPATPVPLISCATSGTVTAFPLQAVPGINSTPLEFDAVNTGTCEFSETVVSITVTLTHTDGLLAGLEAASETIAMPVPSRTVAFPLDFLVERDVLSSLLSLGTYSRRITVTFEDGDVVEVQTPSGDVATEVVLVDAPTATT